MGSVHTVKNGGITDALEPLAVTFDELISDDKEEVPFFLDSEENDNAFAAVNTSAPVVDTVELDVQPVVDPLDELLDQKTSLI